MITDILNKEHIIEMGEKVYKLEFDNKAYARAEQLTGKGLFCLYEELLVRNNLTYSNYLDILCCGLIKHYSQQEIDTIRTKIEEEPYVLMKFMGVLAMSFMEPLMPPEIMEQNKKKASQKKKTAKKSLIG